MKVPWTAGDASWHVPTYDLGARGGASEAEAIAIGDSLFQSGRWRRGSGYDAAVRPAAAAKPSGPGATRHRGVTN